jgi:thiol-disulfide isomerase/thioredoxin
MRLRLLAALASALLAGALLFAAALAVELVRPGTGNNESNESAFRPTVPAFDLPNVFENGPRVRSTGLAGRPYVINVFDHTCAPCVRELPMINAVSEANPDVPIIGVHLLLKRRDAAAFVERLDVTFPVAHDIDGVFAGAVLGLPTTIFMSPDGSEVDRVTGAISEADLLNRLERLRRLPTTAPQGIS